MIIVCADTSPRNVEIACQDDSWDFGSGAGFYVDATNDPWTKNYRMYSYITSELISLVNANFPVLKDQQSISGHSMGGHGALICALRNPGLYKSVTAFAPICNPIKCPWGVKAFTGYLGSDSELWKNYDATELVSKYNGPELNIVIDQVQMSSKTNVCVCSLIKFVFREVKITFLTNFCLEILLLPVKQLKYHVNIAAEKTMIIVISLLLHLLASILNTTVYF